MYCLETVRIAYEKRALKNPSYSKRKFARDLGVSASWLSCFLRGQKGFSLQRAQSIAAALNLGPRSRARFEAEAQALYGRSKADRKLGTSKQGTALLQNQYRALTPTDLAELMSWESLAILEALKFYQNGETIFQLSEHLGLSEDKLKHFLNRLLCVGLVLRKHERWLANHLNTQAPSVPTGSEIMRKYHKEMLAMSTRQLEGIPAAKRSHLSMILSLHPQHLDVFQKRMLQILNELDALATDLSSNLTESRVYGVCFSLFPVHPEGK